MHISDNRDTLFANFLYKGSKNGIFEHLSTNCKYSCKNCHSQVHSNFVSVKKNISGKV